MDPRSPMRGDDVRLGWRSITASVVVAVLLLHALDSRFLVDGYTMALLALLIFLALAGELESARITGFEMRFRKAVLRQIERNLDEVESDREAAEVLLNEPAAPGSAESQPPADLRVPVVERPGAAVITFFADVERVVGDLARPLQEGDNAGTSFARKVDLLTEYRVIPPSEAHILLELFGLRDAYAHGRSVDPDEAARVVAVGARLLPTLSRARTRLSMAFVKRVEKVLETVPGLEFDRQPVVDSGAGGRALRPDFLITSPRRIVIEVKLAGEGPFLHKQLRDVQQVHALFPGDEVAVVIPSALGGQAARAAERSSVAIIPIDRLRQWLEQGGSQAVVAG